MRRTLASMVATLVVGGALLGFVPAASAQTGYPPGPCVPANGIQDDGTHAIGTTFVIRLVTHCLWDPGTAITVTVNGQAVGTKIADAGSGVNITVHVVSATELSIDDPVSVRGQCGENRAVGVGPSSAAGGALESQTSIFRVLCPGAGAPAVANVGGVAFTGANILRWGGFAAVLLGLGTLIVFVARRRRETPTS